jgi:Sec-independent protein secretion pathway component TatC
MELRNKLFTKTRVLCKYQSSITEKLLCFLRKRIQKTCVTVTSSSMKGIRLHQIPLLLHCHLLHSCKSKATRKWLEIFTILIVYIVKTLWSGIYVLPPSIASQQLTPRQPTEGLKQHLSRWAGRLQIGAFEGGTWIKRSVLRAQRRTYVFLTNE